MAAGDLTDLASLKAWLGVTTSVNDDLFSSLITAASDWIKAYLNLDVVSTGYTDTFMGTGSDTKIVANGPISAISAITLPGQVITAPAGINPPSNGFLFDGFTVTLIGYTFPYRQPCQIAYTAGWATVPPAIQQACTELAGEAFRRRDRIGQVSNTLGGQQTVAFSQKDMVATTATALQQYRRIVPA